MKKYLAAAMTIILSVLMLYGCRKDESLSENDGQDLTGFVTEGELTGGGTVLNANLCSLKMKDSGADTVLTFDFTSDSTLSGTGTEREVANPPYYKVYALDKPYRLVIEFESLAYWDYERDFNTDSSELIRGAFNYSPEQGGVFRLYLQLSDEAAYKVVSEGSVVTVTLRPVWQTAETPAPTQTDTGAVEIMEDEIAPAGTAYYVLANAYRDYCSGSITTDEMTPVLSADGMNILLISEAFSSKNAAETMMENILSREENAVRANWEVVELADNALPEYTEDMDYQAAYDVVPARLDGAPREFEIVIPDGLFLAMTPDNAGLLYSRRVSEYEAGGSVSEYEVLCVKLADGASRQLLDFEFQEVESVKYSPDGRKLAVLEQSGESMHLYVFDVDSRDLLTDLSSMGFGDTVSAYCWDSMGGRIFSIGGSNKIVVNQYDFNVPDESKRCTVVDKKGVDETSLAFLNGEVFFCETTLEDGPRMYRIKPEGGLRKFYLAADAFAFSEDDRYLAYTNNGTDYAAASSDSADGSSATEPVFAIVDLQSGAVTNIETDFCVYTFMWSKNASKLFYFEDMLSGNMDESGEDSGSDAEQNPYPYRLWAYDRETGKSSIVADLTTTNIDASASGDMVYICYVDPDTLGDVVRATYALNLTEPQ